MPKFLLFSQLYHFIIAFSQLLQYNGEVNKYEILES